MSTSTGAGVFAGMFDWLRARFAADAELGALTPAELDFLATDIGLSPSEFRDIASRIDDHSAQMEAMMRARGLEPAAVRRAFSGIARQMELLCAQCRDVGRCRRALAAGTAAETMRDFCRNADTIDDLANRHPPARSG